MLRREVKNKASAGLRALMALVLGIGLMVPSGLASLAMPEEAFAASGTATIEKTTDPDDKLLFGEPDADGAISTNKWKVTSDLIKTGDHVAMGTCINPGYDGREGEFTARAIRATDFDSEKLYRAFIGAVYYSKLGPGKAKGSALMPDKNWAGVAMTGNEDYANQHVLMGYYFSGASWTETFRTHKYPFEYKSPGETFTRWFKDNMLPSGSNWGNGDTWGEKVYALTNDADMKANGGYCFDDFAEKVIIVLSGGEYGSTVDGHEHGWRSQYIITWSWEDPTYGQAKVKKASANASVTSGNSCYSLAGAKFGLYKTKAKANADEDRIDTLTTNASGATGASKDVEEGTYWVRELTAPPGYKLDTTPKSVTISGGETATVSFADEPVNDIEKVRVQKRDQDRGQATPQGAASLAGAEFTFRFYAGHYNASNLPASPTRTWVMRTGANGVASPFAGVGSKVSGDDFFTNGSGQPIVPLGTVTVVETKAPEGYRLGYLDDTGSFHNPKLYVANIVADEAASGGAKIEPVNYDSSELLNNANAPFTRDAVVRGNVKGVKSDSATPDGKAQGEATLAGAKISIINRNANAVVSPEDGATEIGNGGVVCTLTTDESGSFSTTASAVNGWTIPASFAGCALPYGTYELREVAPPEGYNPNTAWSQTVTVNSQDQWVTASLTDPVIRGDFDLYKISAETQRPIANVPFVITSKATGERHVMVTDSNGYLSTASAFRAHSTQTNVNDAAVRERTPSGAGDESENGKFSLDESALVKGAGVWFSGRAGSGGAPVDDALGALPYDTYTVDEVRCSANADYKLVQSFEVTVDNHGWKVGPFTIEDDKARPTIGTTLTDGEGTHSVPSDGKNLLTDVIAYADFEAGDYLVKGKLHLVAEDGSDAGVVATAEKQVTLNAPHGTVDVGFVVDTSEYADAGYKLVATEEVYNPSAKLVSSHEDLTDESQTVHIPEVRTTLTDLADGDHEISSARGSQTITDHVVYQGLSPFKQYTATLTLHKKNSDGSDAGALFDAEGNAVVVEQKFFPVEPDGAVDVSVTFTPADGGGYGVVAFEEIKHRDTIYALHADISDENQTVWVPGVATSAADAATGVQSVQLGTGLSVVDTVDYAGLLVDAAYTMKGALHRRAADGTDAGVLTDANGNPVTAEAHFTPSAADGQVKLLFETDIQLVPGEAVVAFEELVRDETGEVVAEHADISDEAQTVRAPKVSTTAVEKSKGMHVARAISPFTIADAVDYEGLEPGVEYLVRGEAHAITDDGADAGSIAEASVTFTPERADGRIVVEVDIDPVNVTGKIVMFEEIGVVRSGELVVLAAHKDAADEEQTVYVPSIDTQAYDRDSKTHDGIAGSSVVAIDEVSFSGLEKGAAYTIKGVLMDKATGEPFLASGCEVTVEEPFVAQESSGKELVEFNIENADLDGAKVVMFERLYDASGELIVAHEDIDSEEQSVSYHAPSPLEKASTSLGKPFDKTGYWFAQFWWILAVLGVGLLLVGAFHRLATDENSVFNREEPETDES